MSIYDNYPEIDEKKSEKMDEWLRMRYVKLQIMALNYCDPNYQLEQSRIIVGDIQDLLDNSK